MTRPAATVGDGAKGITSPGGCACAGDTVKPAPRCCANTEGQPSDTIRCTNGRVVVTAEALSDNNGGDLAFHWLTDMPELTVTDVTNSVAPHA